MEKVSDNYTREAWVAKFDLKSFFMSIDREVLFNLLIAFTKKYYRGDDIDTLLYLIGIIIHHNPQEDCEKRSPDILWHELPPDKSLFHSIGKGMPIGNLPSQLFANFYLSFMDHFILERCEKVGAGYLRFVDDFVIVAREKEWIMDLYREVKDWLEKRLHLTLHPDKVYLQHITKGVKFVGTVVKPWRRYTSNRTLGGMVNRIREADKLCAVIEKYGVTYRLLAKLEKIADGINSYFGFCVHTQSYTIRRNMFRRKFHFWKFCYISGHYSMVKIRKEYRIRNYLLKMEVQYADKLHRGRKAARSRGEKKPRQTGVYDKVRGGGRRRATRT